MSKCKEAGFSLKPSHVTNSLKTALMLVEMDAGAMIIDDEGGLFTSLHTHSIPFEDEEMYWNAYLIYRRDSEKKESILRIERDMREVLART